MEEEWKPVDGTDGLYLISSLGRVKSFVRGKERLLKQIENNKGYYRVQLIKPARKRVFVHRLVALAFVYKPNGCNVVNHKDFNPKNNSKDNLEWTTMKGNSQYSLQRGRFERTEAWIKHHRDGLIAHIAKPVIGERISDGHKIYYDLLTDCKADGFDPPCVSNCCHGIRKTHKGYTWRFVRDAQTD